MTQDVSGKLLISNPALTDPNFSRTIVFICLHDANGAFGLVLNRPSVAVVGEHLPEWLGITAEPPVFFRGGPVEPLAVMALGKAVEPAPIAGPRLPLGLGVVNLKQDAGMAPDSWRTVRFFSGYSGWGERQLDGELEAGGWFVCDAHDDDVLTPDPAGLWSRVVQRVPDLAMYRHIPADPQAN